MTAAEQNHLCAKSSRVLRLTSGCRGAESCTYRSHPSPCCTPQPCGNTREVPGPPPSVGKMEEPAKSPQKEQTPQQKILAPAGLAEMAQDDLWVLRAWGVWPRAPRAPLSSPGQPRDLPAQVFGGLRAWGWVLGLRKRLGGLEEPKLLNSFAQLDLCISLRQRKEKR